MTERPTEGGSYTRAKPSGKLKLQEATKPPLSQAEQRSSSEAVAQTDKRIEAAQDHPEEQGNA